MMEEFSKIFIVTLIAQVRAQDKYDVWAKKSNDELLSKKYIKTKEDLKKIPIIADITELQISDIRLIFQALALAFEEITGEMCSVVMEMNHEGFGRAVVLAEKIVVVNKFFKEAHRFGYRTLEDLANEGGKLLKAAIDIYNSFKK
ncbi:MAG: NifX-associated nitrogen fixation protein [Campylobacteraceae bacterium]|jgi:probable nitrogen fixation protein|nr:NifX-associated nitrogen fixation protein [Campylobacteraceae bacterium]